MVRVAARRRFYINHPKQIKPHTHDGPGIMEALVNAQNFDCRYRSIGYPPKNMYWVRRERGAKYSSLYRNVYCDGYQQR